MTAPDAGRRGPALAVLYVFVCLGAATMVARGVAVPWGMLALLLLLLPAGIVVFAVALNVLFVTEVSLDGAAWQAAFVLFVAVLAVLQAWMFLTMARNWRRTHVELRPTPVTTGADTGL